MAGTVRYHNIETRTARMKLRPGRTVYWRNLVMGRFALGYQRKAPGKPGRWVTRTYLGPDHYSIAHLAVADDYGEADGDSVLTFADASARALRGYRGDGTGDDDGAPATVAQALDRYEADLTMRRGDTGNATRVRRHLHGALASKAVAALTKRDLLHWRDALIEHGLAPASVNRSLTGLRAALTFTADQDERIANRQEWRRKGLNLDDASRARNVVLAEADVRRLAAGAREVGQEVGLFVDVAAITGARPSQLVRLEVQDLQDTRDDPRLMMPPSRKGNKKSSRPVPVPIPESLARRLRLAAAGRPDRAPLLVKPSGGAWRKSDHIRYVRRAVQLAGLDPAKVTAYALRHSSIVRQLMANVPIRVVAVNHDTSVPMIEANYSRFISDHSDPVSRRALLDLGAPPPNNVVPVPAGRVRPLRK